MEIYWVQKTKLQRLSQNTAENPSMALPKDRKGKLYKIITFCHTWALGMTFYWDLESSTFFIKIKHAMVDVVLHKAEEVEDFIFVYFES